MNSATIDLIYLDPPFNSNANYAAPIGSEAAGAEFKDTWGLSDIDEAWCELIKDEHPGLHQLLLSVKLIHGKSMMSYLVYMAPRLIEMHRLLKPAGSLFLHCDRAANSYLRVLLDSLFRPKNFRAEIIWKRSSSRARGSQHKSKRLGVITDTIFHYSKTDEYTWHPPTLDLSEDEISKKFPHVDNRGRYNTATPLFCSPSLGDRPNLCYAFDSPHGPVRNPHPSGWRVSKENLAGMDKRGEIIWREGKTPLRKKYLDDYQGKPMGNLWDDISNVTGASKEHTGYPTQKPVALLERIIKTTTNPGDFVMDPFCGCATACIAAESLGSLGKESHGERRQWLGIDISKKAADLVKVRMAKEVPLLTLDLTHREDIPKRTDLGSIPNYNSTENKDQLYGKQSGYCKGCGDHFQKKNLTVDHIVPRSKAGTDHITNLQLLCGHCNSLKGDRPQEYLGMRLKELGFIDQLAEMILDDSDNKILSRA